MSQTTEEIERSAALIERLLGEPELRRRFRADAAGVLREHGLDQLARGLGPGRQALLTLEMRESRSSLAGASRRRLRASTSRAWPSTPRRGSSTRPAAPSTG